MASALLSFPEQPTDTRLQRSIWFMGSLMTIHQDAKDTKGGFALVEVLGKPGLEPPLHRHDQEDELFFLLEGTLRVTRGEQELFASAGKSVFLPRHVPHTFKVLSETARWLTYITPGGFEDYFRALGKPATRLAPEAHPTMPDQTRLLELGFNFGITFLL